MADTTYIQECDDVLVKMKACRPNGGADAKDFRATFDHSRLFYDDLHKLLCKVPADLEQCEAKAPRLPLKSPKCIALLSCCMKGLWGPPALLEGVTDVLGEVDGNKYRLKCLQIAGQGDASCDKYHAAFAKRFESLAPYPKSRVDPSCK